VIFLVGIISDLTCRKFEDINFSGKIADTFTNVFNGVKNGTKN